MANDDAMVAAVFRAVAGFAEVPEEKLKAISRERRHGLCPDQLPRRNGGADTDGQHGRTLRRDNPFS